MILRFNPEKIKEFVEIAKDPNPIHRTDNPVYPLDLVASAYFSLNDNSDMNEIIPSKIVKVNDYPCLKLDLSNYGISFLNDSKHQNWKVSSSKLEEKIEGLKKLSFNDHISREELNNFFDKYGIHLTEEAYNLVNLTPNIAEIVKEYNPKSAVYTKVGVYNNKILEEGFYLHEKNKDKRKSLEFYLVKDNKIFYKGLLIK